MRRLLVLVKNVLGAPLRLGSHVSAFAILQRAKVDPTAAVCLGVKLYRSRLRRYSYIGRNSFVCDADIGQFCSIADECCIGGAGHPAQYVSTSPVFYRGDNILKARFAQTDFNPYARTRIGNDVWIGHGAMIRAGVRIGHGAIIGMGSVVTKDVGPYEIWGGNPARLLGTRFDGPTVRKLLRIRWWNWPEARLRRHAADFSDVERFLKHWHP